MSDDSRSRVALFGAGRIGHIHAHNIARHPRLELTVVCSSRIESAEQLARRYGSASTIDPDRAFAEVDAVVIASPNNTHIDLLTRAARRGVPALCEKPLDLDLARVRASAAELMDAPSPLMVGFNRRFDTNFAALRSRVATDEIGRLEQLTITSRDPAPSPEKYVRTSGGIFCDMTIHDFDMARFFVPDLVEVNAYGANAFSDYTRDAGDFDSAVVTMRGSGDELITIVNSRHCAYGYEQRLEAFGREGMLSMGDVLPTTISKSSGQGTGQRSPISTSFLDRYSDAYRAELDAFVTAIESGSAVSPNYLDGLRALELAYAATESARSRRSVQLGNG